MLWPLYLCTHINTQTTRVQGDASRSILYVLSLPGKRTAAVAGRLTAPDRYRTAFTAVCGRLLSTVLLYPSLSSVHLLFICSPVLVQYILYHLFVSPHPQTTHPPITNRQLSLARPSTVYRLVPRSYCLSSINHLWAGRTDLTEACDLQKKIRFTYTHYTCKHTECFETIQGCTQVHRYTHTPHLSPEPQHAQTHTYSRVCHFRNWNLSLSLPLLAKFNPYLHLTWSKLDKSLHSMGCLSLQGYCVNRLVSPWYE